MKKIHFLLDTLFITRPILLAPVWAFSYFGFFESQDKKNVFDAAIFKNMDIFFLIFIFSLSVGAVYIINQLADLQVDSINGGTPLLARGFINNKTAIISLTMCISLSILIPIVLSRPVIAVFSIFSILLGIVYSLKPFYFSGRPYLDFISNGVGYGIIAFGAGWYLGGKNLFTVDFIVSALPYFLLMSAGSISSTLPDVKGDQAAGKCTTAVKLGTKNAHLIALTILMLDVLLSAATMMWIPLMCALFSIPIYVAYLLKPSRTLMESTYKIGGSICMIFSVFIYPLLLPLGIALFYSTKLYFFYRHGLKYPSLVAVNNE